MLGRDVGGEGMCESEISGEMGEKTCGKVTKEARIVRAGQI